MTRNWQDSQTCSPSTNQRDAWSSPQRQIFTFVLNHQIMALNPEEGGVVLGVGRGGTEEQVSQQPCF